MEGGRGWTDTQYKGDKAKTFGKINEQTSVKANTCCYQPHIYRPFPANSHTHALLGLGDRDLLPGDRELLSRVLFLLACLGGEWEELLDLE